MVLSVLLPKRLSAALKPAKNLHPLSLSIREKVIPCSSAQMTLPEGETVSIRDWVRLYTADGDAGIYRVTALTPAYPGGTAVTLAHGLCALTDAVITGSGVLEGTLGDIVAKLLPHQEAKIGDQLIFASGTFATTPTLRIEYNNDKLLDLLEQACEKLPDHMVTLDQSTLPWKIGCVALPTVPEAEGRFRRNLLSVKVELNDDDLCNRLIVQHTAEDGSLSFTTHDADTIATYGVVESVFEPPYGATEQEINAYIEEFFRAHKEPAASITVDLLDLHTITGESVDKLTPGKLMRCCMPDYGVTINQRIMELEHTDLMRDELAAQVSLRNKTRDASDLFREVRLETSNNRRSYGRSSYKLEQTGFSLVRTYEELTQLDEFTKTMHNEVGAYMDATNSTLTAYATNIETLFDDTGTLKETVNNAWMEIDGMNASISLHAETLETIQDEQTSMSAELVVQSEQISTKVSKNGVISAINQTAESVTIQAQKIDLRGYVSTGQLESAIADIWAATITSINAGTVSATTVATTYLRSSSFTFGGSTVSKRSLEVSTPSGSKTIYYLGYTA